MSISRFFHDCESGLQLQAGCTVPLGDEEAAHVRVLRLREGDEAELFDGRGVVATGRIVDIKKRSAAFDISEVSVFEPEKPLLAVAFAPPKGKRTASTVEQLTELGADVLIPLSTERSVSLGGDTDKWRARAVEACKQCGRAFVPEVQELTELKKLAESLGDWDAALTGSLSKDAIDVNSIETTLNDSERVLWLIGPEGGFSSAEEELLFARGARGVRFSPNILRVGTAACLCAGLTRFFACK